MRRSAFVVALAAALSVVPASTVNATPSLDVVFENPIMIPGEGPAFGPFTASGPAVDAGLMCPSGDSVDLVGRATGATAAGINFHVTKLFTCDDGSGEFVVKLEVRVDRKGDNFRWVVLDGTGDYERLRGVGSGFGYPIPDGVFDVYMGKLHID